MKCSLSPTLSIDGPARYKISKTSVIYGIWLFVSDMAVCLGCDNTSEICQEIHGSFVLVSLGLLYNFGLKVSTSSWLGSLYP